MGNRVLGMLLALLLATFSLSACQRPEDASTARPWVIALVQLTNVDRTTVAGFKAEMNRLGYREGQEVTYLDAAPAETPDRLDAIIRAQLTQNPQMFLVSSTPAALAVKRLTEGTDIPVIFAPVNDPLGAGVVPNLQHPGGHITGIRLPASDDLRLQWLTRLAPHARRVFLPYSADDPSAQSSVAQVSAAAKTLGLELVRHPIPPGGSPTGAIAALPEGVEAIFLPRDSRVESHIAEFVALAEAHRLPIAAPSLTQVRAGALYSYGFVHADIGRQAAGLAHQIRRGLSPGDLPVEMAESSLSINLASARKLGIAIPNDILLQAEHLIRE